MARKLLKTIALPEIALIISYRSVFPGHSIAGRWSVNRTGGTVHVSPESHDELSPGHPLTLIFMHIASLPMVFQKIIVVIIPALIMGVILVCIILAPPTVQYSVAVFVIGVPVVLGVILRQYLMWHREFSTRIIYETAKTNEEVIESTRTLLKNVQINRNQSKTAEEPNDSNLDDAD